MTFIIAEAGVNHGGRLDHALALVAVAKNAGADAVKFQAFTPLRLAPLDYEKQAMLKGLALTAHELEILAAESRAKQIEFMVTPMDEHWLAFLTHPEYRIMVKRIKIGSGQAKDEKFLAACAETGLPIIISNGMADHGEFARSLTVLIKYGARDITTLYCVSKYPTPETDISLHEMKQMARAYAPDAKVGFSSHCRSFWPCVAAAYAGAEVVEAHLALPGTTGPDVASSLLPDEFQAMVREVRAVG